jgi:hypothetical protein
VLDRAVKHQLRPHNYWGEYNAFDAKIHQRPGLHSLAVQLVYHESRSAGREYLDEMLPFLVNAQGLKHLDLQDITSTSRFLISRLREEWQNLTRLSPQISSLESVTISGCAPHEKILFKLAAAGNLSNLRTLVLAHVHDPAGLMKIARLIPNLERLFIQPSPNGRPWMHLKTDHDDSIAAIRAFPPLRYLCLHSLCSAGSLLRIVEQHGPSLKGLIVEPYGRALSEYPILDVSDIFQLAAHCPNLEELRLQIKKSMGSRAECELCNALGKLTNLHSLVLDLHFDARSEPALRHADTPDLVALRKIFINAATDDNLALGIWN